MKLIVLSDTHGNAAGVRSVLAQEQNADALIFLGDGLRDVEQVQENCRGLSVYSVRGNCDGYGSFAPTEGLAPFAHKLIFYTHGHLYHVKSGLYDLADTAASRGAHIALYGHTHVPAHDVENGVHLFNPGSLSYSRTAGGSSYGVIVIEDGVPCFFHKRLTN